MIILNICCDKNILLFINIYNNFINIKWAAYTIVCETTQHTNQWYIIIDYNFEKKKL